MYWLILVGIFIVGVYWMSSKSRGGVHHDQKSREAHRRLLEQKRTDAEIAFRHADAQRHRKGWRRR